MANKRSRPGQSQEFDEITLVNPSPAFPLDVHRSSFMQSNANQQSHRYSESPSQSRQSVFSAPSSPPPKDPRDNEPFLKRCFNCKKLLDHTKDIFIDSPFCTQECRNVRIAIDKAAEDALKKAPKAKAPASTPIPIPIPGSASNRGMIRILKGFQEFWRKMWPKTRTE
ncbi:FCS-Like Zinc finger 5-like isoform X2 [Mercurialis annua]|uniref:FCS-Like Zinc finger 5-like isoform X2 n=1 Tax=Mercurialis annua TaxID=3986 RepID=UPI0024ADC0A4|nr:FCS-Like Zinc finger 5-like isoform X2 [Mercurialis annua]